VLTEQWLTSWATQLETATVQALRDVVSTFPFEAGDHHVGPPSSAAELTLLREHLPWVPAGLVALHRCVGPVSLPDIGSGYFLHQVTGLIGGLDHDGCADQIGEPLTENVDIVVFGTNGGGDLYAIATRNGTVFRLQNAECVRGVCRGSEHGITVVGNDLRDFLERLLAAVTAFANDGSVTDL
jgi:hypothetical protein